MIIYVRPIMTKRLNNLKRLILLIISKCICSTAINIKYGKIRALQFACQNHKIVMQKKIIMQTVKFMETID